MFSSNKHQEKIAFLGQSCEKQSLASFLSETNANLINRQIL